MLTPSEKGGIAELAIALEAAQLRIGVLRPVVDGTRYDLILDVGPRLLRVQCKNAIRVGEVLRAGLRTSRATRSGHVRTRYTADEIDAFGLYCAELKRSFPPADRIASRERPTFTFASRRRATTNARA